MRYTIRWEPTVTKDVVPVQIFILDATAKDVTDCKLEYQVPASDAVHALETAIPLSDTRLGAGQSLGLVLVEGHQHIGAENLTLAYRKDGAGAWTSVCDFFPTYDAAGRCGGVLERTRSR